MSSNGGTDCRLASGDFSYWTIVGIFLAINSVDAHVSVNESSSGSDWIVSIPSRVATTLISILGLSRKIGSLPSTKTEGKLPPRSSWITSWSSGRISGSIRREY